MGQLFFSKEMKFEIFLLALSLASMLADDYIYGGPKVSTDLYPFIARLRIHGIGNACTGSLVAEDLILTAKHCFVVDEEPNRGVYPYGTATFNDPNRDKRDPGEVTYNMKFIENYYDNDIALAKLEKKVTGIRPVKISKKRVNVGDSVRAVGFGRHGWSPVRVISDGHLRHIGLRVSRVEENWIETAVGRNKEGPCAGDSGGPMLVWDGGEWSVVAALFGNGFSCRDGRIRGDDLWSSVRVRGFPAI